MSMENLRRGTETYEHASTGNYSLIYMPWDRVKRKDPVSHYAPLLKILCKLHFVLQSIQYFPCGT